MVTVSMDKIVFPSGLVGDLVSFWTETVRIGTTSITVKVDRRVAAQRQRKVLVTEAQVVYVNLARIGSRRPFVEGRSRKQGRKQKAKAESGAIRRVGSAFLRDVLD